MRIVDVLPHAVRERENTPIGPHTMPWAKVRRATVIRVEMSPGARARPGLAVSVAQELKKPRRRFAKMHAR